MASPAPCPLRAGAGKPDTARSTPTHRPMNMTPEELALARKALQRRALIAEIAERQREHAATQDTPERIPASTLGTGTLSPFERICYQETGRITD